MKNNVLFVLSICLVGQFLGAQPFQVSKIRDYCSQNSSGIIKEYTDFLTIPNVAGDTENIKRNTAAIMDMMKERGIDKVQLLTANTPGTSPVVYGEVKVPGATTTLIFYAHYDGQPVNPKQWTNGLQPFVPKLFDTSLEKNGKPIPLPEDNTYNPEWRLYARSASDDKAGVFAIINAYGTMVRTGIKPRSNLKFFFEGEEEAGSPHIHEILEKYKLLLHADLWIICDGPIHQTGKKQVSFGVRGDTHLDLTVFASKRPLHSGHYGNWAPNPAMMLAKLLASMKDDNGRVTIKEFYDDVIPLSPSELEAVQNMPPVDEQMKKELGIGTTEMKGLSLAEAITQPSLNINGIQSGNVGKMASNQIPTYATAVIDLRLVLGNDWIRQQQKVINHIKENSYYVIDRDPTDEERRNHEKIIKVISTGDGYNAQRTPMNLPIAKKVIEAVQATSSDQIVLKPTSGGSLPLYLFEKHLNAKTITVQIVNHDNNQHAENENVRLKNLFDGFETIASLMMIK